MKIEIKPIMTSNQTYLQMVDNRLHGLRLNNMNNSEIHRMEIARQDILSRMDEDEISHYIKLTTVQLSAKELKEQNEAERIAMEANRDKPSI